MNVELYIAKKILPHKSTANISKPIVRIAVFAIALGLAVMIVAVSIIIGFKSTISQKLFGFASHIQIVNYDANTSFETVPITKDSILFSKLLECKAVSHVQYFATKPAIIKENNAVKGVVVKGIDTQFTWDFFETHILEGSPFSISNALTDSVLISKEMATLLNLSVHDSFITTFVPNEAGKRPRKRRFIVSGIFETNLQEIDERFILADMRHIQSLNYWDSTQVSGYEIFLKSHKTIENDKETIQNIVGYEIYQDKEYLKTQSLQEINPQIFDWLSLLDMNAWVIIFLMVLVAGLNMITGLLVIIIEKTNMIGILKTIGARNTQVQKVFLYVGGLLITKGLLWGNIIGIGLCFLQYAFHIIPLNPETYFMSFVPISFSVPAILLLNIGTLCITMIMLLLPALFISKLSPIEAVSFD
ncbi:MAG TPA: ABC transporter permease [Bacteroidales bacterium]|nr:ABC transporter permease [Bacteroidales bacterium]